MLSERVVKYLIRNEYMKWLDSNIHQKNDDKIVFFSWIQENKPELLNFNCESDKWQKIQTMLSDFS